ncbi:Sensor histidine kinase TodS [Planctomycetes bacterium Poly30]|uniref:histidine kinase n=1 Tax=Saltatorellus ferox TaxID=2528018 RepID=A0A518ELE6_9BACT|nr:Sensor histidine kinase TodS [Planctomycetes bacterium Poly30]
MALGWAGWLVGHAPDELAEAEVASTARLVAGDLERQWQALRNSEHFRAFSSGAVESIQERALEGAAEPPARQPVLADSAEDPRAFVALFREAERLAREGEESEAREVLADALATGPMNSDAPALRSLELRLALGRSGEGDASEAALAAWDRLTAEVDWSASRDGRPVRLLAGWLAAGHLDEDRALALRENVLREGARHVIGGPSALDRIVRADRGLRLEADPETAATLALCESVWPGMGDALRATPAWAARMGAGLERALEPVKAAPGQTGWSFTATPLGLGAIRAGQAPFLVEEANLADLVRRELPLPPGFSIALESEAPGEGSAMLEPIELDGLVPGVQLYHVDPARLIRAGARRRRISAWLLAALGIVCVAAALVAARSLRRERRLAELRSTFVAGISHDLRTPLASILLMAENLRSGRVGQERTAEYAAGISSEAERLRRRVDDVLDFARIERGEPTRALREEVNLPQLARDILGFSEELGLQAGFAFEGEARDLPPSANLDADALRRIAGNLVQNALRHSGGTRLRVSFAAENDSLLLRVEDDGCGIPARDRARALMAFEQLRRDVNPHGGTGLGLAIVSGLVDAMDGTLGVHDGLDGAGVAFQVSLPMHSLAP